MFNQNITGYPVNMTIVFFYLPVNSERDQLV